MNDSLEDARRLKTMLVEQAIKVRADRHHLRPGAERYIAAAIVDKLKLGANGGFRAESGGDLDDLLTSMLNFPENSYHIPATEAPALSEQERLSALTPQALLEEANRRLHPRGGK